MKTTRYIAKCKACGCHTSGLTAGQDARKSKDDASRGGIVYMHANGSIVLDCRKCGQPRYAKMIKGVFSASHECSARCMSSTGTTCECSCAGKNHGNAHAT